MEKSFRRKYPRQRFVKSVSLLCEGKFAFGRGCEIGEGGIAFQTNKPFSEGQEIVINFQIPKGSFVSVRLEVRNSVKSVDGQGHIIGCEFKNLQFESKKEIRSFVSSKVEDLH